MNPVVRHTGCALVALSLLGLAAPACGAASPVRAVADGQLRTQTRSVPAFQAVVMTGIGTLRVEQAARQRLTVQAAADVLPRLSSRVVAGTLELGPRPGAQIRTDRPIVYTVTAPELGSISVIGAGDLQVSVLRAAALALDLEGSARGELRGLALDRLTVRQAGATTMSTAGSADEQVVTLNGAGDYDGSRLSTSTSRVSILGAGSARVAVRRQLTVLIEGAGSVVYTGAPAVQQQILGPGTVTRV